MKTKLKEHTDNLERLVEEKTEKLVKVERLADKAGKKIKLSSVLAISDGKKLQIGTPQVKGSKVSATVVDHIRGEKVVSLTTKRRKGYSRKVGHRQELTILKVESIGS